MAEVSKRSLRGRDVGGRPVSTGAATGGDVVDRRDTSESHYPTDRSVKKPARAPDADAVRLEPHVCRHCFGRLVSRVLAAGAPEVRRWTCTNCGAVADGGRADVLCACGMTLARGPRLSLLRCQPNPAPSPEFPALFVAADAST